MTELKIDPKFRDLIPKLTDDEFAQLEKNILADGRVKEPIVVWKGVIIDGHHRYYIVQKHPEIPYEVEEREFSNDHEALAWACANQLGRRNLQVSDQYYLRGTQYSEEKLAWGGTGNNQYTKEQSLDNTNSANDTKTVQKIAKQHHVNPDTIIRDEQYKKGIDVAEEIIPGMKETLMHGEAKVPKYVIEEIPKVTPDKQRKAVISISEGNIQKAKNILEQKKETLEQYGLNDDGKEISFTIDDLFSEIETNFTKSMDVLENSIDLHQDILNDENRESFIGKLEGMFELKITEFMEEI